MRRPVGSRLRAGCLSGGFGKIAVVVLVALWLGETAVGYAPGPGWQATAPVASEGIWKDVEGAPLPFQTEEELKEYLRSARVVSMESIPVGVTRPRRIVLEKEGIRSRAIFRDVDISKKTYRDRYNRPQFNFRDYCIFECAAYEVSRLLGLTNVPPVVKRTIRRKRGTLQIWLEDSMLELDRQRQGIQPPQEYQWRWNMQHQVMWIFDNLILNEDRNQGNVLIDKAWNIWMIDHTRAFRTRPDLLEMDRILYCERSLWERMQALTEDELKAALKGLLRPGEIRAILKRRDLLVQYFQERIDREGEAKVLFRFSEPHGN